MFNVKECMREMQLGLRSFNVCFFCQAEWLTVRRIHGTL